MQERQATAGGLLRSALGKARGQALRLALVLEMLWWCGEDGMAPPPAQISARAFAAAALLLDRLFPADGRARLWRCRRGPRERNAATLARWIIAERPAEVHVRQPAAGGAAAGPGTAEQYPRRRRCAGRGRLAALRRHRGAEFGQRGRVAYAVNPRLWEAAQ